MANDADIEKFVGRFATMRSLAARAVRESPDDPRALWGAALALRISGNASAALAQFERLCILEPNNTHYQYERGVTLEHLGQFEQAAEFYRAALCAVPENYKARQALVQLSRQPPTNLDMAEMERQFYLPDDDGWRSLHLGHALAKANEDIGELKRSLDWLGKGKARRRSLFPFSERYEAELACAAVAAAPNSRQGSPTQEPIFVCGLPRSGTTLIDRILSSHDEVTSAGEISNFAQLLTLFSGASRGALDLFERLGEADNARLGRAYIDSTRPVTGATPRFVDKAPSNYMIAPSILAALPNARMICVRRHPLDSCLSNYKQIFPFDDRYYDYVYDLGDTARKFIQFDRVIAHWQKVLSPERFMVLQYEELVANQEARTRELLAFCDLSWDARCLNFQNNTESVSTPSARQVRSPMNASAVGRWAKYGALLDPARRVLEQNGIALD